MASSPEEQPLPEICVAAGVLRDPDDPAGRVLIAQRPSGKMHAGAWEFPGGKIAPGETPLAGLCRELQEELGVEVAIARHLTRYRHNYPDFRVHLYVWLVLAWRGVPESLENQALQWLEPSELMAGGLLPADAVIAEKLQTDVAVNSLSREAALTR